MRSAVVLAVAAALGLAACSMSQPGSKPASQTITSTGTVTLYPPGSSVGATFTPNNCYVPKLPAGSFRYSGGPGDRLETAIVIDSATNEVNGSDGEYAYVRQHLPGWKVCGQALIRSDNGLYDRLDLQDGSGTRRQVHFDITSWFGKMP